MAISKYDIFLMLRAQDRASATLRRVAGDLRALGEASDFTQARQRLHNRETSLLAQRTATLGQIQRRMPGGQVALGLEQRRASIIDRRNKLEDQYKRLSSTQLTLQKRVFDQETRRLRRLSEIQALQARIKPLAELTKTSPEFQQRLTQLRSRLVIAQRELRSLGMQAGLNDDAFRALDRRMQQTVKDVNTLTLAEQKANAAIQENTASISTYQAKLARIDAQLNQAAAAQKRLNTAILQARWETVGRGGTILRDMSRSARLAGIAVGGAVAFAAYQFAKLDTQSTLVATQMGRTNRTFQDTVRDAHNIRNAVVQTMRDSTSSTEDLTATAYDLFSSLNSSGQAFLNFSDGAKILKLVSDAAIASQTNVQEVSQGVISTMNAFGVSAGEMPKVMNRLFAAVRFGRMTFGQFAQTLTMTAPAAKAANQTLDTMAGTMAFLTRRLDPRKAATGYARLTEILSNPKFLKSMERLGVHLTDAAGRLKQLPDVISILTKQFPAIAHGGTLLTNFFKLTSGQTGTIQARRAFVFLATQLGAYRQILKATTGDNNEFDKSQKAMSQTLGVRWAKFINRLKADMLDLGQRAIPAIMRIVGPVEEVIKRFEALSPQVRTQIVTWAAWGSAIAIVVGTVGALAGGLLNLVAIFGKWGRLTGLNIVVLAALGATLLRGKTAFVSFGDAVHYAGEALSHFFDFAGSGWKQFVASTLIAGLVIGRVARGMKGGRAGGVSAMAPIPFLPVTIGQVKSWTKGYLDSIRSIRAASAGAGGGGLFGLARASVIALPGPLKLAAAAVGVAAIASYAWHRHMQKVREQAEKIEMRVHFAANYVKELNQRLAHFRQIPSTLIDLQANRAELASLRAEMKNMPKGSPELQQALAQQAQLLKEIRQEQASINRGWRDFNRGVTGERRIQQLREQLDRAGQSMSKLLARRQELQRLLMLAIAQRNIPAQNALWKELDRLNIKIAQLRVNVDSLPRRIDAIRDKMKERGTDLGKAISAAIQALADRGVIAAAKIPRIMQQYIRQAVLLAKGTLTQAKFEAIVRAYLDPDSIKQVIAQLQSQLMLITPIIDILGMFGGKTPARFKYLQSQLKQMRALLKAVETQDKKTGKSSEATLRELAAQYGMTLAELKKLLKGQGDATDNTVKLSDAQRKAAEKTIKDYQNQQQAVQQYTQTIQSAYDSIQQTNKSAMGDFIIGSQYFQQGIGSILMGVQQQIMAFTPNWKTIFSPQMILTAAKQQLGAFKRWRRDVAKATKGMPEEMRQQLIAMGPQGAPILETIMKMKPGQRRQLISYFNQQQKLINKATKEDFNKQLKYWKSLGSNIFKAIMEGMTPDQARVHKWVVQMAIALLRELGKYDPTLKKKAAEAQAILDTEGTPKKGKQQPKKPKPKPRGTRRTQAVEDGGGHTTVNMTVHAHHSESLSTTLRRADFRLRNRAAYLAPH